MTEVSCSPLGNTVLAGSESPEVSKSPSPGGSRSPRRTGLSWQSAHRRHSSCRLGKECRWRWRSHPGRMSMSPGGRARRRLRPRDSSSRQDRARTGFGRWGPKCLAWQSWSRRCRSSLAGTDQRVPAYPIDRSSDPGDTACSWPRRSHFASCYKFPLDTLWGVGSLLGNSSPRGSSRGCLLSVARCNRSLASMGGKRLTL